jgi:hypothetical protein
MPGDAPDDRPTTGGATSRSDDAEPAAAVQNPEHDDTTSREAYELEMAEEGRSEEAGHHGDHID